MSSNAAAEPVQNVLTYLEEALNRFKAEISDQMSLKLSELERRLELNWTKKLDELKDYTDQNFSRKSRSSKGTNNKNKRVREPRNDTPATSTEVGTPIETDMHAFEENYYVLCERPDMELENQAASPEHSSLNDMGDSLISFESLNTGGSRNLSKITASSAAVQAGKEENEVVDMNITAMKSSKMKTSEEPLPSSSMESCTMGKAVSEGKRPERKRVAVIPFDASTEQQQQPTKKFKKNKAARRKKSGQFVSSGNLANDKVVIVKANEAGGFDYLVYSNGFSNWMHDHKEDFPRKTV